MIGSMLAHDEIVGLLGEGGMGQVYRDRRMRFDRVVLITDFR
jgi:hypothetical protein